MSSIVRSRAAEVLGVPADATAGVAAAAFLARLPAASFLPTARSVSALNTLAGLALPADPDEGSGLREEVEEFARGYWALAPADRLAAWLVLSTRSPDDATADRLLTLQGGLDVSTTPLTSGVAEEIAAIARELYVLPTRERAIRRNEWLLANAPRHRVLAAGVATIHKQQPVVVALEPILFERLKGPFDVGLFAKVAMAMPPPQPVMGPSKPIIYPISGGPPPRVAVPETLRGRPSISKDGKFGWAFLFVALVAVRLLVALVRSDSPSPSRVSGNLDNRSAAWSQTSPGQSGNPPTSPGATPTTPTPWWEDQGAIKDFPRVPAKLPGSDLPPGKVVIHFSAAEIARFIEHQSTPKGFPPPNYRSWLLAGAPKEAGSFVLATGSLK